MLLVQVVRIPAAGVADFQRYESLVLPLLARYGGKLERRLRSDDGQFEIHIVSFATPDALERYRADSERQQHLPLLRASGATTELIEVSDAVS
jgi:hypothetical protein